MKNRTKTEHSNRTKSDCAGQGSFPQPPRVTDSVLSCPVFFGGKMAANKRTVYLVTYYKNDKDREIGHITYSEPFASLADAKKFYIELGNTNKQIEKEYQIYEHYDWRIDWEGYDDSAIEVIDCE